MTTRHEGRSEQVRHLGSVPAAGVEPQAILTRVPPRRLQVAPPPVIRLPGHRLSVAEQAEFTAWADRVAGDYFDDIAWVNDPEPAPMPHRELVKVPVAVWLPLVLFAVIGAVTVDWLIWQRSPVTAFFTVGIGFCFVVHVAVERCTS